MVHISEGLTNTAAEHRYHSEQSATLWSNAQEVRAAGQWERQEQRDSHSGRGQTRNSQAHTISHWKPFMMISLQVNTCLPTKNYNFKKWNLV